MQRCEEVGRRVAAVRGRPPLRRKTDRRPVTRRPPQPTSDNVERRAACGRVAARVEIETCGEDVLARKAAVDPVGGAEASEEQPRCDQEHG